MQVDLQSERLMPEAPCEIMDAQLNQSHLPQSNNHSKSPEHIQDNPPAQSSSNPSAEVPDSAVADAPNNATNASKDSQLRTLLASSLAQHGNMPGSSNKESGLPTTSAFSKDESSSERAQSGTASDELSTMHMPGIDPVFEQQATLVNEIVQRIGMGKYQWALFFLSGFGWMCDMLCQITIADALSQVAQEFQPKHSAFLSLALTVGLVFGSSVWGVGSDIVGRRFAFNWTLFIAAAFLLGAGGSANFTSVAVLVGFVGFGVGGNLPVDCAIFLEFLPGTHQYLLAVLSVWWAIGQIIPAAAAMGFIVHFSCDPKLPAGQCAKADNMGWRYLIYTMGGFLLLLQGIRFFLFHLYESPKFLIGQKRYDEAVKVLNAVAAYNGKTQPLTVENLHAVEHEHAEEEGKEYIARPLSTENAFKRVCTSLKFDGVTHVKALFATKEQAQSFILIVLIWGMIGLAAPLYTNFLPEYLAHQGAKLGDDSTRTTYRNNFIVVVCSLPGTLVGAWLVGLRHVGRRGTLGTSLIVTSIFLFASTTARTGAQVLAFNCVANFVMYIMWGALYCYTPEVIPSIHRGTGTGLASGFNRMCGIMAPIMAVYVGYSNTPIFVAAGLYAGAGILAFFLPFETMGKAAL